MSDSDHNPPALDDLQREAMELLLVVRRQAAKIESLNERARRASTLYHRSQTTTDTFARRAAGLQERASNASAALSAKRIHVLWLTQRIEQLSTVAGKEVPPAIQRAKRDLVEVQNLLRAWATDPLPQPVGGMGVQMTQRVAPADRASSRKNRFTGCAAKK